MLAMNPRATLAVVGAAVCLLLAPIVGAAAQDASFDTSRTVTLKGRVATVVLQYTDRTFLMLDVEGPAGRERWAIEGNGATALGWAPTSLPLKLGETVSVDVFRARPGANLADVVPVDHASLQEIAKAGRLARGLDLTFADGRKLAFGSR
jgi:hypothetical protein